uniref:Si:ch211-191j22.3 n=1 Tax=Nothobranchius furzeri TaxID=105023 RepID=A0A8C6NLX5_NOTFU
KKNADITCATCRLFHSNYSPVLVVQVALLRWLSSQSEPDRKTLAAVTGVQVGRELLNRITGQDKVDAFKRDCILSISEYLKENPRASQAQINAEVEKNVLVFAARVKALETAPLF